MDIEDALDFVDKVIFTNTGKHLNDLERQVFIGSWQGYTYEKMYPINPEYVEKDVGYKLWRKLSQALNEKVSKKNIRGTIERALKHHIYQKVDVLNQPRGQPKTEVEVITKRVIISHRVQEPDLSLATQLCQSLNAVGHQVLMAIVGETLLNHTLDGCRTLGDDWLSQLDTELKQCDYFLLLLSPQVAISEMAIEQLRWVKELRDSRSDDKPLVLAIRVNCPLSAPLNHDLRSYLQGIRQYEWTSPTDTHTLVQAVLKWISGDVGQWGISSGEEVLSVSLAVDEPSNLQPSTPDVLIPTSPPLPVAEPELPSGQVRLASAFYVERVPYEALCYKEILQPGALIRIKAPRQMGKTSLMARILYQAKEQGYRTVPLSFQHADAAVFKNLNELLKWFCATITRKLRLPHQVSEYWTDTYGSKITCTAYFEDCLLSQTAQPLVLGLDEVDRVFQYPTIADDFFGLLRAWYEEACYGASDSDLWEKLRLVVVHSTEVYIPLDVNQSPFNVGLPIELAELTLEQVWNLAQRHGLNWQLSQVEQLMQIVGGHPYLVRVAFYHIAQQHLTLQQLIEIAPTEAGIYGDHLRRHLWNLQQHAELATAFSNVVTANAPVELKSVLAFKLHSLGLVQLQGNEVTPRFELYRHYFRDRLKSI